MGYCLKSTAHYMLWSWRFRLLSSVAAWTIPVRGWSWTSSSPTMRHAWSTWRVCAGRKGLCAWAVAGWERSGEHRGGVSSAHTVEGRPRCWREPCSTARARPCVCGFSLPGGRGSVLIGECTSDIGVHVHRNAIFMCAPALPYVAGCLTVAARPPELRRRSGAFGRRWERPPLSGCLDRHRGGLACARPCHPPTGGRSQPWIPTDCLGHLRNSFIMNELRISLRSSTPHYVHRFEPDFLGLSWPSTDNGRESAPDRQIAMP